MTMFAIRAAFIPLLDASLLIAARDLGMAAEQGIDLQLMRETSWANVRDRMAVGHVDVAHMLAPMPIAANLGLTPFSTALIAPMALGLGGNAITVSLALHEALGAPGNPDDAARAGALLHAEIGRRAASGKPLLRFGVVHPHSSHNLELRYWLAACGIAPDRDVEIVILPPSFMPDALAQGDLDGYCVGEPWNTEAEMRGVGRILTTKQAIWANSPEKVLGMSSRWAGENPDAVAGLLTALYRAARWCGDPANGEALAEMLAAPEGLGLDVGLLRQSLAGPARFVSFERAATFPWQSHALWFYSQMVRWGQVAHSADHARMARQTYRPDLYRAAILAAGGVVPSANAKVEGALSGPGQVGASGGALTLGPDGFFDRRTFDPDRLDDYIAAQSVPA
ncbi:nitrate transporter [Zhengella mangrovi]|uniref:Nitrate transporter n=1 Tax=Zhengella mangrovi TaxID=1982044 RepID=A0A2G1QMQ9_9HYPH|nr:CmpA/NrtA family ABC transporter substrate-binding protein [Zhengella mangrovi]PHP66827.1 nitrate transporter [Zhengella mangrovi]